MATYSTNLGLTLLATGEGAGTWGNTTNTNLGTLLEQSISGYETQSLTAGTTLTLTIPNGTSGVARNMYLEFTGTGSTVIVPSNKKLYFVYNNCSSGTISFKVAGQTGVTIPNGAKQILVSNGTDIQEAITPGVDGETTASITALGTDAGTALTSGSAVVTIGYKAGESLTSGGLNTFVGHRAGATVSTLGGDTYLGYEAGSEYNQGFNTFVGYASGRNVNSTSNTAVGYLAGRGVLGSTTGSGNCAFGYSALESVTSGGSNVAIGAAAALNNSTGERNTFIGYQAAQLTTTSSANVAVGYQALNSFTATSSSGYAYNVALGFQAGVAVYTASTGSFANTLLGGLAGYAITTGASNTAVGFQAYYTGNYSGSTCLGESSTVTGNNQIQLGFSGTTTYAYGAVQDRSDERDKADIQDTQLGLDFVMALRPRDFKWDMREDYRPPMPPPTATEEEWAAFHEACKLSNITHDGTHKRNRFHHGLIAQEVKQTMDAMGVDFGGYQDHTINGGDAVLTIGYEELIAPLIKAIQELKSEFDEYKRTHP